MVYVVKDGEGIAPLLASRIREQGGETHVVESPDQIGDDATAVISLEPLRTHTDFDSALNSARFAFQLALKVAKRFEATDGLFVLVQDTGGNFGFDGWCEPNRSPLGGIAGLAKTAAREWSKSKVRVIDLDAGHRAPTTLADELFEEIAEGHETEVGLPEGGRSVVELVDVPLQSSQTERLGPSDVVVVTGGARGVTAECVVALAQASGAKFILLGRSALVEESALTINAATDAELKRALMTDALARGESVTPKELTRSATKILNSREVRNTLRRIRATGGDAVYLATDITDVNALYESVQKGREQFGPITSLIHGAGVLADRRLVDKTADDFDFVVNTKVAGFYALSVVTNADPIHTVLLFSSVAGRFGNVGQADYAMANEILNKMAHVERASRVDCLVKSLAWGPWDGGMVTPGIRAQFEAQGISMIPLADGASQCVFEFNDVLAESATEIVIGDGFPIADTTITIEVSLQRMPWLADHSINGNAVVPMVCAIDWLGGGDGVVSLSDVSVRRPLRLPDDSPLVVERAATDDAVSLVANNEPAYSAVLGPAPSRPAPKRRPERPKWEGSVYDDDLLFHGPEFHFLKNVDAPAGSDWWASIETRNGRQWASDFRIDVPALDGALQLAVLWSGAQTDGRVAPMSCESVQIWNDTVPAHAELVARKTAAAYAVCDIHLYAADGEAAAALIGVKCVKFADR